MKATLVSSDVYSRQLRVHRGAHSLSPDEEMRTRPTISNVEGVDVVGRPCICLVGLVSRRATLDDQVQSSSGP